jgi:hypothetical protein
MGLRQLFAAFDRLHLHEDLLFGGDDKVTECHVYGETMSLFNQLSGSAHE